MVLTAWSLSTHALLVTRKLRNPVHSVASDGMLCASLAVSVSTQLVDSLCGVSQVEAVAAQMQ